MWLQSSSGPIFLTNMKAQIFCNNIKYLRHIPTFYRDILIAFDEIKTFLQGAGNILLNLKQFKAWVRNVM